MVWVVKITVETKFLNNNGWENVCIIIYRISVYS